MRTVVQRVSRASVVVEGQIVGAIGRGLLVYAAAAPDDDEQDVQYIADKVANLRMFEDAAGKMNLTVGQMIGAEGVAHGAMDAPVDAKADSLSVPPGVLLVSAFTVLADARKGRRPSFDASATGPAAEPLIARLADMLRATGLHVETGQFGAHMQVEAVNDGPICILLDSRRVI
jgi:D-tyrosyl-tRNA(Tyr) deacylase